MSLPPAVVIHGLPDALAALRSGRPVTLLSGPGAASYACCGWWRALVARARADFDRRSQLLPSGAVSQAVVTGAEGEYRAARARL